MSKYKIDRTNYYLYATNYDHFKTKIWKQNFLGFSFLFLAQPAGAVITQLVVNNDVVVDSTLIQHFQVLGTTSDRDYYPFPRPLNGQDTIVFNFNNAGAQAIGYLVVYYI